jgi:cation diffusion facilitator CzcD-associated flavoprotein CzcO
MSTQNASDVDVVVVGAGFVGLYAIHRLRGEGFSVRCFEAGGDVGGTWYWNRYPGARCDVESLDYSYSFSPELEQEWSWTERYATQPEILRYLQFVADRFDLRRDVTLDTRVEGATLDEDTLRWTVRTSTGEQVRARYLFLATGPLSVANTPDLPGQATFEGRTFHTGAWPHEEVDFRGRRVAVIGTGSSGIQAIPMLAEQAEQLYVLQRTPNFSIPAQNWFWQPEQMAEAKAEYRERRKLAWASAGGVPSVPSTLKTFDVDDDERRRIFEEHWKVGGARFTRVFLDSLSDHAANAEAVAFVRSKIHEVVHDPEVADLLTPQTYPLGTKRVCVDTGYYATFNRENVTLVDVRKDPIAEIEPGGVRLSSGLLPVDDLVYATGFDAMTGAVSRIDLRGRNGLLLREAWAAGPRTLLGLAVAGFPNVFLFSGPGSPSVLTNMVLASEQQVNWVLDALGYARAHNLAALEAEESAQDAWDEHCSSLADNSMMFEADSWYVGANIPGKPRVLLPYLGGMILYTAKCDETAADGYRGFAKVPAKALPNPEDLADEAAS